MGVITGSKQVEKAVAQQINYPIKADFGFGKNLTYRIPYPFFGVGGVGSSQIGSNGTALKLLQSANLRWTRLEAQLELIFPNNETPNYKTIDAQMSTAMSSGFSNIIVIIDYTPGWLVNNTGFQCNDINHYPPSNYTEWGKLAAAVVKHIDTIFKPRIIYYEIWNEPDAAKFLCVDPAQRESVYFKIFSAAAAEIRKNSYNGKVEIGGPTLANPYRDIQMIYDFVHDRETYPYVNFVSYHQYAVSGLPDSWNGSSLPVLSAMQGASTGYAQIYVKIASIVHNGLEPNASKVPIFITEYNTDTVGPDCCGSSYVFSPLYNSILIMDLLNSVYLNGSDRSFPFGLTYFTLSSPTIKMCMIGHWDSEMDCSDSLPVKPYPQFYPYFLIGNLLGLGNGSYLAPEVYSSLSNLIASAFFSKNGESLVVANSGNKSYSTSILFENNIMQGNSLNFTLYEIKGNTTGEYITKNQTGFYEVSNGYAVQVSVGPYSVIGISLRYSNATVSTSSTMSTSSSTTSTSYSTTSTSSYTTTNTSGSTSSFSHSSSTTSYTTSKSFSTSFTYSFTTSFSSSSSSVSSYTTSTKTQGIQVPQLDYLLAAVLVLFVLFVIALIVRRKR